MCRRRCRPPEHRRCPRQCTGCPRSKVAPSCRTPRTRCCCRASVVQAARIAKPTAAGAAVHARASVDRTRDARARGTGQAGTAARAGARPARTRAGRAAGRGPAATAVAAPVARTAGLPGGAADLTRARVVAGECAIGARGRTGVLRAACLVYPAAGLAGVGSGRRRLATRTGRAAGPVGAARLPGPAALYAVAARAGVACRGARLR